MVHVQFKIDNINMKKYKLGDFLDNYGDGIHGTPKYDINGDYYFINGSNLGNGKIVINDDIQKVSAEEYTKIRRPIVNGQTILVSINGTLGKFAIYHGEKIGLGKSACFLNLKEAIYVPFIFAILMTKEFKTYLHNIAGQSTIKNVSPNQIANYEFYAPSSLCDCIAYSQTILKINEKIELNRQINDNLEAMAKQLYDYWFVQFDFPNEEGKPYKSSGGAMVWNEKLKREIPQGWSVLSVNDIAASVRGVSYTKEDMVDSNNGVLVLRGNNIQDNHLIYDSNVAYIPSSFVSEDQCIRPLDIIMTMSSGSKEHIGKSAMFQFASENTFGAFLTKFTAKEHCAYLLFNLFNSQYFRAKIKSIACGTGINNLTNQTFDEIYIVMPEEELLLEFDKRQSQIFAEIGLIEKSNIELTMQRDELLPLLMNGQAVVNSD